MVIRQGEIWWADLPRPSGSEPGHRRPVLIVQGNSFNESRIGTAVVVVLTSNMRLAEAPGNVALSMRESGLPRDSVANVSAIATVDRTVLRDRVGVLTNATFELVLFGIDTVLGR